MKTRSLLACFGIALFAAMLARAYEFQPIGFESIGMGGAGVASARGTFAGYYNPALLAKQPFTMETTFSGGTGIREYNLAENIDRLADLNLDDSLDAIESSAPAGNVPAQTRSNLYEAQRILTSMSDGENGLSLMPTLSLGIQMKNIGIGVYGTSDGGARAMIHPDYLDVIVRVSDGDGGYNYYAYDPGVPGDPEQPGGYSEVTQDVYEASSLEYALNNGLTYLRLDGIALMEVPVSYARKFETAYGPLSVGASAKYMQGIVYAGTARIDTGSDDVQDALEQHDKTSTTMGIDAGVLLQPKSMNNLTLGLVVKNLNSPKLESPLGGDVKLEPMVRAGVAMGLLKNTVDFAMDFDVTKNASSTGDTQYVGGGVNFHPTSWFCVRAGAMHNLANDNEGTSLTGGVGLGLKWMQLDLSGVMSTKKGSFDGNDIPRHARLNLALVSRW